MNQSPFGSTSNPNIISSSSSGTNLPIVPPPSVSSPTTPSVLPQRDYAPNILDQNLNRPKKEVSETIFSFLFAEVVQYCQSRVNDMNELHEKLMQLGIPIGQRLLELCVLRDKNSKREIKVNNMLGFIGNTLWKTLYGRGVSTIERAAASTQTDTSNPQLKPVITRYMIYEKEPLETKYISPPRDMNVQCAYFSAGIIKGALNAADFRAEVRVAMTENRDYTVFLIDFEEDVIRREL
ncbi:hypothetical protein FDP41_012177 [Naegleria fowleri]|uniref:Trafficking protein particle complex subunit n=1 Tax=Naegleria fowleri TaxID=5763 RepID=A0A6A5C6V8_NAEFO|nr:uncharacterized protein FDP41_012177 [Naegleria fowleri]KAF0981520.1 hypothetical protein FDP41_012177 [Naegleria fowleri]